MEMFVAHMIIHDVNNRRSDLDNRIQVDKMIIEHHKCSNPMMTMIDSYQTGRHYNVRQVIWTNIVMLM